uniref:Uncharacterized protein n=1 Tax=Arundo donax TaxID=35708 RepID=A0A0A9AK48_ARUDO
MPKLPVAPADCYISRKC